MKHTETDIAGVRPPELLPDRHAWTISIGTLATVVVFPALGTSVLAGALLGVGFFTAGIVCSLAATRRATIAYRAALRRGDHAGPCRATGRPAGGRHRAPAARRPPLRPVTGTPGPACSGRRPGRPGRGAGR